MAKAHQNIEVSMATEGGNMNDTKLKIYKDIELSTVLYGAES